jgi:nitrous oxidase accessory protein
MGTKSKSLALVIVALFLTSIIILPPATVKAQSKTIIVPDDYSTIQAAIENAANGDTIFVKSGTYQENAIDTTKSLSIIGEGSQSTILNLNASIFEGEIYGFNITSYGKAINVNANNFTLSGFTINTNGGDVGFNGNHTTIANNTIATPFSADGYYLDILNNTFLKANFESGFGVNRDYPFEVNLEFSRFSGNKIIYQKYNNCPVTINGKYVVITDNTISGASVYIVSTPCFLSGNKISNSLDWVSVISSNSIITKNVIDNIDYGFGNEGSNNIVFANEITNCGKVYANPSKHFWPKATFPGNESGLIFGNNFINNFRNLDCSKMLKIDSFDNGTIGNYWSDYNGTDSNGDGIGDTPYLIDANRTDFYPLIAPFNITTAPNLMPNWAQNLTTILLAMTDNGLTVTFSLGGNVTRSQISNVTISTNQLAATTTVSFVVTGQSGNTGFSNITIPISVVPYGTTPSIYINGQPALNQGITQDTNNYYVWYTINFSTHIVSIVFAAESAVPGFPSWTIPLLLSIIVAVAGLLVYHKKHKKDLVKNSYYF